MRKYFFYSKIDSSKEPIFYCNANSIEDAILIFADGKDMDVDMFNELYSVERK